MIYLKNSKTHYGLVTILLHWIMAIIVIGMFFLGDYMVDLDYYDQWYHTAPWWHKSIGGIVFMLLLIRLFWRFINSTPEPLQAHKKWESSTAKAVHILFYILLFFICVSGYFISTAKGVGIEFFAWFDIPPITTLSETNADIVGGIHDISTQVLLLLVALHALAAFKHHFINKDKTLVRIINPEKSIGK